MKLLLHICCAPCSIMCIETLRGEGIEPVGFWDNPNIHPFTEFRMRRNTLVDYAREIGLSLIVEGGYGLRPFLEAVGGDFDGRCATCYRLRMRSAARYAAENGFTHFTTTLLISPYQNHELLAQTAREAGLISLAHSEVHIQAGFRFLRIFDPGVWWQLYRQQQSCLLNQQGS